MFGNTNAPPAVTHSAIIYALRCMVTQDIPLNQARLPPPYLHEGIMIQLVHQPVPKREIIILVKN